MGRMVHRRVGASSQTFSVNVNNQAIFNQLLWDIGVSQAQVHEIYSLDMESFEEIKFYLSRVALIQTRPGTHLPVSMEKGTE